jgi:4a-hydroxytetrahydrobiopterin dehydratase
MNVRISPHQFEETVSLEDWRVLGDGACVFFSTESFAASTRFVRALGDLDGVEDHPPAVDVREGGVTVRLVTVARDYMGMTRRDADLARRISALARDLGLSADPSGVQSLLVIPGAADIGAVMPFWNAVLGYEPRADSPDEDLVDPHDRGAALWLEQMEEPRPDGGGAIHVAVWVPHEQAEARVAAALAAGGRLVRDEFAPSWWTLADPAGNEAYVATTRGRE